MKTPKLFAGAMKWTEAEKAVFAVTSKDGGPVEVSIAGYIGDDYWDETATSEFKFAKALEGYEKNRDLTVNINSQGGSVKDGLGIYNFIKRWEGKTTARITGFACSISSIIPLACDVVVSPKSSNWMIHDPLCMTAGNSADHAKSIEMLESCASTMAAIYAEKTGKTRKQMRDVMKAETWFTGEEAKSFGLSDEVTDETVDLKVTELINEFRNVPQRLVAMLSKPKPTSAAISGGANKETETMQKEAILALLAQHGKTLAADATTEQIMAALDALVMANKVQKTEADRLKQPENKIIVPQAEFDAMKAQLRAEKEMRIRAEFQSLSIDRPYLVESEWLPKLYADESLMALVRAQPVIASGTHQLPGYRPATGGSSIIDSYRAMKPGPERLNFAVANWHSLEQAHTEHRVQQFSGLPVAEQLRRLAQPQAVNTYSATLVTDRLADQIITTIGSKLAALRGFSREFGTDRFKPRATVQIPMATTTSAVQTNPTNFETGDSTTTNVAVSVNQINKGFHTTNDQLNSGHTLMRVVAKNAQTFSNAISDAWTALLTVANFGAVTQIGAAASFDALDLAPIYALAKNYGQKNLILDGGHLAFLLPTDKFKFRLGEEGAYNFDLIAEQNLWSASAAANTVGFICDPNAIAVASGLPADLPSGEFIELGTVQLPGIDLTVQLAHWFSRGGRVHWMSYDVMFGAAAGDTTAGEVLTT